MELKSLTVRNAFFFRKIIRIDRLLVQAAILVS